MTDDVKGSPPARTRTYDASGRRTKARETRRAVLSAAQELVEERGVVATTIAEVAARAGVSPETIYKGFGTKAALVKEVFDVAIAGDDEAVAVADRPEVQRIREEPELAVKLRLYAENAAERGARTARLQLALRDAAPSHADIAEVWGTVQAERLRGMQMVTRHFLGTGQVRADLDADEAADVLWTCISVEVYDLFVLQRGWTPDAYTDWLTRTLCAFFIG
jgi:AcrR family transcriptional regulator